MLISSSSSHCLQIETDFHSSGCFLNWFIFSLFQELPQFSGVELPSWLSGADFGNLLSVLEFFCSFSDQLNIREYYANSKVTFADLIEAISSPDKQESPLTDIFNVLLRARAERGDEEDGDEGKIVDFFVFILLR